MSVRRRALDAFLAVLLAVPLGVIAVGNAEAAPSATGTSHAAARVCQTPAADHVACGSLVVVGTDGRPQKTATPAGYGPNDLREAYALATAAASSGSGETVAIVDAYDDPNALSDVNAYRSYFGIPQFNSTGHPTFIKVGQNGGTALPRANSDWSEEISVDLDMVSAICPNCNVLLVESNSTGFADLATAVNTAAGTSGVVAVSNSYGGTEIDPATNPAIVAAYDHSGIAVTASSGDSGYGVQSPASFPTVTAVGGTSLSRAATTRGWTETAWSGSGSGCSAYVDQSTWQGATLSAETGVCAHRVVSDVSAVADPNTGVAVYDTYGLGSSAGWLVFGGTSVSSPIIASVYALAGGQPGGATGAEYAYAQTSSLFDVTTGANGSCPSSVMTAVSGDSVTVQSAAFDSQARPSKGGPAGRPGHGGGTTAPNTYLCQAQAGYDGPTGLGTPNGTGAF